MIPPRTRWSSPPEALRLADGDVHVWRASIDLSPVLVHELAHSLSEEERITAGRFAFERDRRRFISRRAVLRGILGRYLGAGPWAPTFRYSPLGKPSISPGAGEPALRFSVSHADGVALYGITIGREIGIDVERVRRDFPCGDVAERFFSSGEIRALRALSPVRRPPAFFRCWTRKEGYVKARGEGLSAPLDRFEVSLVPGEPAALLGTLDDPHETARWCLRDLPVGFGYVAAVAVEGPSIRLSCWHWSGA